MLDRKRPVTSTLVAMTAALLNLEDSLARGDDPNRSIDFVRDVERWCKRAMFHLSDEARRDIEKGAPSWTLQS